jgi:phosphatidylglycerophosphatase A
VNRLKLGIVSCGYLGLSPLAPGTFGTLGGVAIALALAGAGSRFALFALIACAAIYAVGRSLGEWSERYAGRKDPGFFVLDEVIGYLVTCLWTAGPSLLALTVAFFVFRFFDIVKPPPARRLEALGGGDGILLDDVIAGLYGLLLMAVLRLALPDLPWAAESTWAA